MHIDVGQFLDSIPIMLKGFLGVFLILGIIIITTVFLNAVTKKGEKNIRSTSEYLCCRISFGSFF